MIHSFLLKKTFCFPNGLASIPHLVLRINKNCKILNLNLFLCRLPWTQNTGIFSRTRSSGVASSSTGLSFSYCIALFCTNCSKVRSPTWACPTSWWGCPAFGSRWSWAAWSSYCPSSVSGPCTWTSPRLEPTRSGWSSARRERSRPTPSSWPTSAVWVQCAASGPRAVREDRPRPGPATRSLTSTALGIWYSRVRTWRRGKRDQKTRWKMEIESRKGRQTQTKWAESLRRKPMLIISS